MTITPLVPGPAALAAAAPEGAVAQDATSGDFLALVQQAMADALAMPVPGDLAVAPEPMDPETETATPAPADAVTVAGPMALATGMPQPLAPVVQVEDAAPSANARATEAGAPGTPVGARAGNDVPATQAAVRGQTTSPDPSGPPRGSGPDDLAAEAVVNAGATPGLAAPAAAPTDNAANPLPTGAGPVTVAPVTAGIVDRPSGTDAAQRVTSQVFPEVTSLASRGNGSHRITLTLNPEALGEVRVVMTVRDGSVVVRLAAGQDAQRALVDGSPELTRLLELAGASETRIVVRDLAAASTATGSGSGSGSSPETGPDTGRSHDQHAGTRAHQRATDGTNDGTIRSFRSSTGADPSQSIEPVTGARTAGVDVTM